MSFPLPFVPQHDYHSGGLRFGASRPNDRKHAGCDLLAEPGTEVLSASTRHAQSRPCSALPWPAN